LSSFLFTNQQIVMSVEAFENSHLCCFQNTRIIPPQVGATEAMVSTTAFATPPRTINAPLTSAAPGNLPPSSAACVLLFCCL
jgi:hypothetical protein